MTHKLFAPLLLALAGLPAWAGSPVFTGWFSDTAIKGYDPVAYFTEGQALKGKKDLMHRWNDADWLFATAEHRDLFAANPERYAPQYGGYCAYALAVKDALVKVDPEAWTVVNDKLYLNYSTSVRKDWLAKQQDYIVSADGNWPRHARAK